MDPLVILLIGMLVVIGGILGFKLHPFLALILAAIAVGLCTSETNIRRYAASRDLSEVETTRLVKETTGRKIAGGLGRTAGKIGILIAMAALIGKCLLESGAAERIVRSALRLLGEKRAPAALMGSSFVLGIPVYFDTVFYLMIPLAKSIAVRVGRNFGLYTMAIIAGATMAHSLVPPTPGPLLVASELNVDLGKMILGGLILGSLTMLTGYAYAVWANRQFPIPLRDSPDISVEELHASSERESSDLPPLWLSLMPIALPVLLIAGDTILPRFFAGEIEATLGLATHWGMEPISRWLQGVLALVRFLGNKDIALTLAGLLALGILACRQPDVARLQSAVQKALTSAGTIILITAAGGAFGGMLQQTGIGPQIQDLAARYQVSLLPLAFLVTTLIRTAQGSATVAMITSVGIFSGMVGDLGFDPLYLALAIGCGSKPFPWMNDSGFWVICKMSGMTEKETLKTSSTLMSLMAVSGLLVLMVMASLLPHF